MKNIRSPAEELKPALTNDVLNFWNV